ncbi:hypothetical protein [Microbacterium sp. 22242]|uniref:hypothetical protein n=1 Tax=Microbacterium sp. 22242 TaxID=3453896 RepID=UPI003F862EB4
MVDIWADRWVDTWSDIWGALEPAIIPVRDPTTGEVLYGDRITSYRWELMKHLPDGTDVLLGVLDGVIEPSARLSWALGAQVKGGGNVRVADLDTAAPGMLRIRDVTLETVRIRPVCVIDGLPEIPLSVFLVTAAPEEWSATGRVWALELLDRCTVLDQDKTAATFSVAAGTQILTAVQSVIASAGEQITVDASVTTATSAGMVWPAGTTKLTIVNDLLDAGGFNALWVDGYGAFQATKYVLPADRGTTYEMLNMPRELVDGETSIYQPEWTRDRDQFGIPNRVIAVQNAGGADSTALVGQWDNTDPTSPYSYPSRGRWIVETLTGTDVPDGDNASKIAFLTAKARRSLIAYSSGQAVVKVTALPLPVRVSDVIRFQHTPAGVDGRHVLTHIDWDAHPLGLTQLELTEVADL